MFPVFLLPVYPVYTPQAPLPVGEGLGVRDLFSDRPVERDPSVALLSRDDNLAVSLKIAAK